MAHAHAELTGGFAVAMATAGPGVTNTVTAMANASLARAPVLLIGGCTSRPQANMGPLQDIPHVDILRPVTRASRTLRIAEQVIRELDEAVSRAMGDAGEPGPVYVEVPTDVLRTHVPSRLVLDEWIEAKPPRRLIPDPAAVGEAVGVLWSARRPLVITGRGARGVVRATAAAARCHWRALSRHPGKPWPGAGRSSLGRCRDAYGGDDGSGRRSAHWPQARLPGRLRVSSGVPARALHSSCRQSRRIDRQSSRPAGVARRA
jgi:thiamine pyrophosphate-dependent acetolactate synthase large subunit-like protein